MRRNLVFIIAGSSLLIWSIDSTAVSVAFPVLTTDLNASLVMAGLVMTVYQVVGLCCMPVLARISDSYGRKRVLIFCLILFALGSLMSALARDLFWLIFFRAVQGLGAGGFMPAATGIVADIFPDKRQSAVGLISSIYPFGYILGPTLGGIVIEHFSWHWVFFMNVPVAVIDIFLAWWLIQPDKRSSRMVLDLPGAGLLAACIGGFMTALSLLDSRGSGPWWPAALAGGVSIASLVLFRWWERRAKEPIIDLKLLVTRPFRESNIYQFVFGATTIGVSSLVPLYATAVLGLSALGSGLVLLPRSVGQLAGSTVCALMLLRWGYRKPILSGTLVVAVVLFLLALEATGISIFSSFVSPVFMLVLLMLFSGLSMGVASPAANNACIEMMPEKIAMISGLRGMFRQMGAAMSITVATFVLHLAGDIPRGFVIVLVGLGIFSFASIPAIFAMPAGPDTTCPTGFPPVAEA